MLQAAAFAFFEEGSRSVSASIGKVARQGLLAMEALASMEHDPCLRDHAVGSHFGNAIASIFTRAANSLEEQSTNKAPVQPQSTTIDAMSPVLTAEELFNPAATEAYIPFLLNSDHLLASANTAFSNSGFGIDWSQILTDSALFE